MVIHQQFDQLVLCGVRVLVLIYHDVGKMLLPLGAYFFVGFKQLYRAPNEIVKVQCDSVFERCLVQWIHLRNHVRGRAFGCFAVLRRADHVVFSTADIAGNSARRK